ncbi:MOSC N-terminal beta barrel domain-containing protein [Streptomyces sp. HSW2009]|uniref:MOSC domain-containing protein n=1 Tax=Streptomyces sp. HSW2009 TaxID=3142890 RepID=UPI0032F02649
MSDAQLSAIHVYPVKSVGGHALSEATVEPWGLAGDRRWLLVKPDGTFLTQRQLPRLALGAARPLPDGSIALSADGHEPLTVSPPDPESSRISTVRVFKDPVELVWTEGAGSAWFSELLGREVHLVHLDDPARRRPISPEYARPGETVSLADSMPLLLTTTASLAGLNALIAQGEHAHEGPLPMNRFRPNVVVDGGTPWAEDGWRKLLIGDVVFRVAKPSSRCVITTTDQRTTERGREPLWTLAAHHRIGNKVVFGQNLIPEHTGTLRVGDPVKILE